MCITAANTPLTRGRAGGLAKLFFSMAVVREEKKPLALVRLPEILSGPKLGAYSVLVSRMVAKDISFLSRDTQDFITIK